jgi:tight adherence protein C
MADQHLLSALVFTAFACATYAVARVLDRQWLRTRARVNELLESDDEQQASSQVNRERAGASLRGIANVLQHTAPYSAADPARLQQRLTSAGFQNPAALPRFLIVKFVLILAPATSAIAAGLLGYMDMGTALLMSCSTGGIGALAPSFWLDRRIQRRHLLLRKSLPDFLDLMVVCLEGGLSIQETLRRVGEELQLVHPILAAELGIVQRDMELGASLDQGLKRFATRTDYEGVRTFSTFIRESQRFGTNITEALRNHSDMLRSQREQAAEETAQKAAVKILLPTMLLIFPAIFIVLVGPAIIQIQEAFAAK